MLQGTILKEIVSVRDLGTVLDSKLTFKNHLQSTLGRAKRNSGLIMRHSQHFLSTGNIKNTVLPISEVTYTIRKYHLVSNSSRTEKRNRISTEALPKVYICTTETSTTMIIRFHTAS